MDAARQTGRWAGVVHRRALDLLGLGARDAEAALGRVRGKDGGEVPVLSETRKVVHAVLISGQRRRVVSLLELLGGGFFLRQDHRADARAEADSPLMNG